ncbi:interferon-induced very large GTPase 1-like [Polypterus senegalus]
MATIILEQDRKTKCKHLCAVKEADNFLVDINNWVCSEEEILSKLLEFQKKLYETTHNFDIWIKKCLPDPSLENILSRIVSRYDEFPHETNKSVWLRMHAVLLPPGLNKREDTAVVRRWLHSPEAKIKHQAKANSGGELPKNKVDELSLLLSIANILGYAKPDKTFGSLLGPQSTSLWHDELQKSLETYYTVGTDNISASQALLILTGLTLTAGSNVVTPDLKTQRLDFISSHLQEPLCEDIVQLLSNFDLRSNNWQEVEEKLVIIKDINNEIKNHTKVPEVQRGLPMIANMEGTKLLQSKVHSVTMNQMPDTPGWRVIERLGLKDYCPKKLTTSDFLVLDMSSTERSQPATEKELPFFYLQKLFMVDYRAREVVPIKNEKKMSLLQNCTKETEDLGVDDFFNEDNEGSSDVNTNLTDIHFMDVQMAIYHCADMLLWQYIVSKLSFCQYALPLLVPNPFTGMIEFPLWSFRPLKKSWKSSGISKNGKNDVDCKNASICETIIPIVSFLRLGQSFSSKSQILNGVINNQKHNTFYHRHCKGSRGKCHFMDGVVEISWYCPRGKDDDLFNDCIAFANLRGDARDHPKQLDFLLCTSSVIIILMTDADRNKDGKVILEKLLKSQTPLICLCADKETVPKGNYKNKVKIPVLNQNQAELFQKLRICIKDMLYRSEVMVTVDNCAEIARNSNLKIDEDDDDCKAAMVKAESVVAWLKQVSSSAVKELFFPLQGDLWHSWCKKNKELTRLQAKEIQSIEQTKSTIESEKGKLRREQYRIGFPPNEVLAEFITYLKILSVTQKKLFLKWLGIRLDEVPALNHSQKSGEESSIGGSVKQKSQKTDMAKEEWEASSLKPSTLGLEILLRELGQIYEALDFQSGKKNELFLTLPQLAAELMITGYPIELLDGDASHIPVTWINSVLQRVIEKLGDKRIFVLSVLGIQSTGKSTLLNSLFGLQFAVSAGQCTRGAFMQLIKVKEGQEDLRFDYLLVIDTEGLRALELGNKSALHHDNELATFVIGIANLTLVNIFGENPSDMQDILQIAVQAFLRMKKINLSPSCIFVHQNVGDVLADERNREGRYRLKERLDDMTQTAAKQEVCDVTQFKDVIRFDIDRHVHYFTHLWEGNPPMAPPNPSYCENVQKLKEMLFSEEMQVGILKMSQFKARVQDFWSALLDEDFVFSFKNTLEVGAYRKLSEEYGKWSWQLRSEVLEMENDMKSQIENHIVREVTVLDLEEKIRKKYENLETEIEQYFENDKDKDILAQWSGKIKLNFKNLKEDLIKEVKRVLDSFSLMIQSIRKVEEQKSKYEMELMKKSQEVALQLKDKATDETELKKAFENLWIEWVTRVKSDMPQLEDPIIEADFDRTLSEHFENKLIRSCRDRKTYQKVATASDFSIYLNMKKGNPLKNVMKITDGFIYNIDEQDHQCMRNLTKTLIQNARDYIEGKETTMADYNQNYIHEMMKKIYEEVKHCDCNKHRFEIKKEYSIDVALHIREEAVHSFQEMHYTFKKANNPLEYLQGKKSDFFESFKMLCSGTTMAALLADKITQNVKKTIRKEAFKKVTPFVIKDSQKSDPALNGDRANLEQHILQSLMEKCDFQEFIQYASSPKSYYEEFIRKRVDEYFSLNNEKIGLKFQDHLNKIGVKISKLFGFTIDEENTDPFAWLNIFAGQSDGMFFSKNDFRGYQNVDPQDITFFRDTLENSLLNAVNELKEEFNGKQPIDRKLLSCQPDEMLIQQLNGCWVTCPLCHAVCANSFTDHEGDHSTRFHRPQGVSGIKWHSTDRLVVSICSSLVESKCKMVLHKNNKKLQYKQYRKAGPEYANWSIKPDRSTQPLWKWFLCQFKSDLEKEYNGILEDIPPEWNRFTKEDVMNSLMDTK